MGRKGGSAHLKREMAPKFWPIHRKAFSWTVKPKPGPHPICQCVPLVIMVREMLGLAKTKKEARTIISQGKILVDGKIRSDEHFPMGLMDVVSIPEIKKDYRLLPSQKGLFLNPINADESKFKLCRIEGKETLDNGRTQLNLHDGRNLLIDAGNPKSSPEVVYRTLDVVKISLPEQEILERLKLEKGMLTLFAGGANIGKYGTITDINVQAGQKRGNSIVAIKSEDGETFQTTLNYAFVIGDKTPRISLRNVERQ